VARRLHPERGRSPGGYVGRPLATAI
jgi:hypothetical protein